MVKAIDEGDLGIGIGDDESDDEVDKLKNGENGGDDVEEEDEVEDEEDFHQRAWREASGLYWDAVTEIKEAIESIVGCGVLHGQLALFEAALRNLEFNVEMWKEESPSCVLSQEKFALFQTLVKACDAALKDIVDALYLIQMSDEDRLIEENGNLVYVSENGNRLIINETHNPFEERRSFVKDIISILCTARQIIPDIYELE